MTVPFGGIEIVVDDTGWTGLPPDPPALPSLGVSGWTHRWHALRAGTADGDLVPLWNDATTTSTPDPLTRYELTAGSPEPTLRQDPTSGLWYVECAGIGLTGNLQINSPATVAVLVRAPKSYAKLAGYTFGRANNNAAQINFGNGQILIGPDSTKTAQWLGIVADLSTAGPAVNFNGTEVALGAAVTPPGNQFRITQFLAAAGQAGDIADLAIWPTALSASQRATVYTALKAESAGLLP